ncbi:hypothetical protein DFH28DRAFT_1121710 [Melampsora americana]|nr:hypothetical protein DFH28DRAFT_1121710 [Melampsora americana]
MTSYRSASVPNAFVSSGRPVALPSIMEEQELYSRGIIQNGAQAGPLPFKVGEFGYVEEQTQMNLVEAARQRRSQSFVVAGFPQTNLVQAPRGQRALSHSSLSNADPDLEAWGGRPRFGSELAGEFITQVPIETGSRPSSRRPSGTLLHQSLSRLFTKPLILLLFSITILILTTVGFFETQRRISDEKALHDSQLDDPTRHVGETDQGDMGDVAPAGVSFAYLGTIFVVALLVEACILMGSIRSLYHRLGSFVDQRYPNPVPDPSDPGAILPAPPALPWWAKALKITPELARTPPLPPYTAVYNIIRTGSIAGPSVRTGDIEDGEVIRTLAMGQGKPAPAFGGEEFRQSTVLLKSEKIHSSSISRSGSISSESSSRRG